MTAEPAATTSAAKRPSPPPPADLSKPHAGQPPFKRSRDNKFDPSLLPPSDDADEILKQVEFYFGDANLPKDRFLWTQTQLDPKREGWVPISTIASFKRMQRFASTESIVAALRQSQELLEVNEDGTAVRRKTPLVKPTTTGFESRARRTIYAKGFGAETPTLQVDLEAYFRGFGACHSVRLRRTDTGLFKGSILAEFKAQADADKFLAEPHEWDGSLLETKTKDEWIQSKKGENDTFPWEEDDQGKRQGSQKHFSAYKEMEKQKKLEQEREASRKAHSSGRGKGRRGRDSRPRGRSRSPPPVEKTTEPAPLAGEKRPGSPSGGEAQSKREKLDESTTNN